MHDREFLIWLLNRLVMVYGESPGVDFCGKLASIIERIPPDQLTPNTASAERLLEDAGNPR